MRRQRPCLIGIAACVAAVCFSLSAASAQPEAPDAPALDAGTLAERKARFDADLATAKSLAEQVMVVAAHADAMHAAESLRAAWLPAFRAVIDGVNGEIIAGKTPATEDALRLTRLGEWAAACHERDAANDLFRRALALDPRCQRAQQVSGFRCYHLPTDDDAILEWEMESLLLDLEPHVGKWLSPEEFAAVKELETRVLAAAKSTWESWRQEPFLRRAHQARLQVKRNTFLARFEFETIVCKPFVLFFAAGDADANADTDAVRKAALEAVMRGLWAKWKTIVADWELRSANPMDSLENPLPLVWIGIASPDEFRQLLNQMIFNAPPGTAAFYDARSEAVLFCDSVGSNAASALVHEAVHQLVDRFTEHAANALGNHAFTEGFPEFLAGFQSTDDGIEFGTLNLADRAAEIRRFRATFDGTHGLAPFAADQPDWLVWDVPLLMAIPNAVWTQVLSRVAMQNLTRTPYVRTPAVRAGFSEGRFHGAFYAFAWAFTHFMQAEYPAQFAAFAKLVLNGGRTGEAQTWLAAFEIAVPDGFPDLAVFADARRLQANFQRAMGEFQKQVTMLREMPEIRAINAKFIAWIDAHLKAAANGAAE